MKIVITMTSWSKRISCVGESIFRFMKTQTIKPDIFYLWLSEMEFPRREQDLPNDLLLICKFFKVRIKWVQDNEYCFKRWYVYPEHYDDLVVSIDDDQIYDSDLLDTILHYYNQFSEPSVISFHEPGTVSIHGIDYDHNPLEHWQTRSSSNFFLGQCAFAPHSFPLETISPEVIQVRKKYCPKCDESVLHPFLIHAHIPIGFCAPHQKMKAVQTMQTTGLFNEMYHNLHIINGETYKRTTLLKYIVLHVFPYLQSSWLESFPNYEMNKICMNMDALSSIL